MEGPKPSVDHRVGLLGQGEDRDSFTDSPAKVEHHSFSTEVLSESSQHGTQPICESCCGSLDCRSLREPSGVRARLALRPVLILGTLLGIIHSAEKGRLRSPSFYYSVVMTCGLWANVVLSFRNYSRISFNSMMFLQITLHVVSTEMAVMNSTFLLNTSAQLPRLFREWDKYIHRYHCSTVQRVRSFGLLMIVLIYVILLLVMSGVFVIYVLETRGVSNRSELLIKHYFAQASGLFEGVTSLWVPFIICCISLFQVCIWFWPVIFLVTICYGLKVNFQELSTVLKSKLSSLDEAGLEAYRFRYQELCKIVNMVDDIFSLLAIFIYLTGIPLLCFSVYNFAFPFKEHAQWSFLFVVVADIGFLVGQVGMVTISASALSSQAVSPRDSLLDIQLCDSNSRRRMEKGLQLMLFLHRLTHTHVGLTAWKIFNINRQTILTVITVVVSNVLVLIKFGLSLDSTAPETSHNCTGPGGS